jgi:hypothetical protein
MVHVSGENEKFLKIIFNSAPKKRKRAADIFMHK